MDTLNTSASVGSRDSSMAVYRRIRKMIFAGKLGAGEALSQVQLAQEFDTSRGPVREALRMLQREGLIEAEANQRVRIVSFSASDLEQLCAMLALNAAMAIRMGEGRFTAADVATIERAIDRIETLGAGTGDNDGRAMGIDERRRIAFRRLLTVLCRHSGAHVKQLINDILDRLAVVRQLYTLSGSSPPYPLANRFPELREAALRQDAVAMAQIIVDKIAEISRKAVIFLADHYRPDMLDTYVVGARAAVAGELSAASPNGAMEGYDTMTIKVRALPGSRLECVVTPS
ncbi:GntR family transcriptional regulator [Sphingobium fluviale]|nr:GntR family transcriptional regulator [Sphingobium fluviale]